MLINDSQIIEFLTGDKSAPRKGVNANSKLASLPFYKQYSTFVQTHLLHDSRDIVFVNYSILYLAIVASTLYQVFVNFSYIHFIVHVIIFVPQTTTFVLMLHCIHHRPLYKVPVLNHVIPYIIAPFFGQTWETFYFHHIKHHHIEDNGPRDLSSTLRYQRDNLWHFICYFARFYFIGILELPLYFINKGWYSAAVRVFLGEYLCQAGYFAAAYYGDWRPAVILLYVPYNLVRFGMMSGNWGQHAFVDPERLDDDYVQSITCINTPYNQIAFNDGYHTSHHLNPRRHWADHPGNLYVNKSKYGEKATLVFQKIDFHGCWAALVSKNYNLLAESFVPLTEKDAKMNKDEIIALLKKRTKQFTHEEVEKYYGVAPKRPLFDGVHRNGFTLSFFLKVGVLAAVVYGNYSVVGKFI